MIVRSTIYSVVGGDNLQVQNTASELRKLGLEVDIILANQKVNYDRYDLLHLFNIIRPADHLIHIRKSGKPVVISTIYLDYSDFDKNGRGGIHKHILKFLGKGGAEYLKNNFRYIKNQDTCVSKEYFYGHNRSIRSILSMVKMILPNSNSEYKRICNDFGVDLPYHIIPNGVNRELFTVIPEVKREERILCVGQIYGLKNQHRLILAAESLGAKLTIIGKSPPNHKNYYKFCKSIAGKNVEFVDFIPQNELLDYYASSKVHALPSWFETTGLSSLEAGAMGCNLVVGTGGDTGDYFGEKASFCIANDMGSINDALRTELNKEIDLSFRNYILEKLTWTNAAQETLIAYQKVLELEK